MIDAAAAADANLVQWGAGRQLVRCFNAQRGPVSFNPTDGSMRFRPIYGHGAVVPTAYIGEDRLIALAETVLRESAIGADAVLPVARLRGLALVDLVYADELQLVQLNGLGLRKLKLSRGAVIDTGPDRYEATADLAQVLYDHQPDAQGIVWTSHQADHGDAAILWQTRLDSNRLEPASDAVELDSWPGIGIVRDACERCGVLLEA